jgi:anti-sigma regulatory factor (Ser/Thr protein kinase)
VWPDEVTVRQIDGGDHVVLAVRGSLSAASANLTVRPVLRKHLLDRGRVVVDLSDASVQWAPVVELFPATLAGVGGWPLARLALAGPDPTATAILRASRVHLTVPVAKTRDEARTLLDLRPPRVARRHEMPCALTAPGLARSFVASMCDDWQLDVGLRDAARMVATELVSNAVEHAGTGCVLYLALDRQRLQIAVRDQRPTAAGLPQAGVRGNRGYGLLMVEGASRAWGVTPHEDGKTVWAVLDTEPGTRL